MTTATDTNARTAELVDQLEDLGTLPEVTMRINVVTRDANSDAGDLEQILRHDPALVARIMKVVNSAFYGQTQPVASVERAIVLLGFNNIQKIAAAASLGQLFKGKLCTGFAAKDMWSHCIAVAVVARDLAMRVNRALAEEVFLAGMTHDLGLLVALQLMPEKLALVCDKAKDDPRDFCEIEREILGVDHAHLGAALAEKWKFPESCRCTAAKHHELGDVPPQQQLMTGLVHVADSLCCQESIGFNRTAMRQRLSEPLLASLSLSNDMIEDTQRRITALAWSAITIFS
jgi:putative nucleotidyltransferase with HDIG domain